MSHRLMCAVTLVTLGCQSAMSRERTPGAPPPDSPGSALALYNALYDIGTTRREVRARLGRPITTRADTVSNRHVDAIDSVFVWTYGELEFHFYWATPVERELLLRTRAAVTYRSIAGWADALRTPSAARNHLGAPAWEDVRADTTLLHFPVSETELGADDLLVLYFVAQGLVAVAITPYVD